MVLHEKYAKEPWRHIGLKVPHHGGGGGGVGVLDIDLPSRLSSQSLCFAKQTQGSPYQATFRELCLLYPLLL